MNVEITKVENGWIVRRNVGRNCADRHACSDPMFVYRTVAEIQADLPKLLNPDMSYMGPLNKLPKPEPFESEMPAKSQVDDF